ncbi:chemotaxis protein CheB [Candidatus Binatia bacterium]|jgi:two-component system chemotaxis response regulator CheB|nr:chemotaxis protein CheB [Candidatus Binatia bacterium]
MTTPIAALKAHDPRVLAIGASAGAVEALLDLLPGLPPGLPATVLVVVHVPRDRRSALPMLFAPRCVLPVLEAEDKIGADPGHVYFAPAGYHLLVERDGTLALSSDDLVNMSRPSIDVLFESVAYGFGPRTLGIVLSGANADGARGLACIRERGGLGWVQDPTTARVALMPEAAIAAAHPDAVLAPAAMADALAQWGAAA